MERNPTFELRADHVRLLRSAYVWWDACEYGAPAINCKRPYGDSDGDADVCRALGWELMGLDEDGDPTWTQSQRERARQIHRETEIALQIVLCTGTFAPGVYVQRKRCDTRSWVLREGER